MADLNPLEQGHRPPSPGLPAVLIYSHFQLPDYNTAYGFPQGKVQRYFYPESNLNNTATAPPRSRSNSPFHKLTKMPKKATPIPTLNLGTSKYDGPPAPHTSPLSQTSHSPLSPNSPMSSPSSPYLKGSSIRPLTGKSTIKTSEKGWRAPRSPTQPGGEETTDVPPTPGITAIPPYPPSPKESSVKHGRDPSRSFFANLKASKSTHKIQATNAATAQSIDTKPVSRGGSKDRSGLSSRGLSSRGRNASTPDLSVSSGQSERTNGNETEEQSQRTASNASAKPVQEGEQAHTLATKKSKPRFTNLLARTRSIRVDDPFSSAKFPTTARRPSNGLLRLEEISTQQPTQPPIKTAPLQADRKFRDVMASTNRNRSADRQLPNDNNAHNNNNNNINNNNQARKERVTGGSVAMSTLNQVSNSSLFSNLKQTSSGAAYHIGKAGKGFFSKISRSGSSNERELVTDDNYVCSVINLPLIEQTRRTRISKRLENSRDKTEFWMPALPWRCIDYLNFKGCEEEGLYRVPGSGKDVKHWQRRFDTELDINLFDEPELYDINTIGSMFKAWLRELPDEIFPKKTQAMIAEKCMGATTAPQLLKDELSKLPPQNYYLLFAITCHLSLLHSYVDKNKMDYRNLCICFQPCMKIDGFCFQFLVCDWKNCWQGCWTEKEYMEKEVEADRLAQLARLEITNKSSIPASISEERAVSSSGSSQAPPRNGLTSGTATQASSRSGSPKRGRKHTPPSINSAHSRSASQLPELGPPLSPIKI